MRRRGFSWRQTTVAKTEGGDRPVLFAEVIALAQIFKRPLDFFLFAGTAVDVIIDNAKRDAMELEVRLASAERMVQASYNDLELNRATITLGEAVHRFLASRDLAAFNQELVKCLVRFGHLAMLGQAELFEIVGIDDREIKDIDRAALLFVARREKEREGKLTEADWPYESGEMLSALSDFLDNRPVPDDFLFALRQGSEWATFAAGALIGILQEKGNIAKA
jgi:hypothetical protein